MDRFLKRLVFFVLAGVLVNIPSLCHAQGMTDTAKKRDLIDSTKQAKVPVNDTVAIPAKAQPFQPKPKKAGLYSALLPGLGQLYNRQYWKIPVVYVGIGIAGYFFIDNSNKYTSYREAYIGRINNPNPTDKYVNRYDESQLQQLQNDAKKYLDMTVLFSTIGYALQVMDAVTSAHLKNFDISRDISMRMHPIVVPGGMGMAFVVSLK